MGAEPIPHELLLRHAGFLRRLARDLVGDPAAADDAVQEVWLRALERPPRHGSNVRGWLRVVLTNLVRTRARDDSRRNAREIDHGAGRESTESAEQQSVLRSVTEAVLALEEPLRTTVLQHYFQGLTTAEIAQRENLPMSTVKSRLQRALELLRLRLQRAAGDSWHAALLALLVPAHLGKGAVLMSLKSKLAVCAALLLATGFVAHEWPAWTKPGSPSAAQRESAALEQPPETPALTAAGLGIEAQSPTRAPNAADPASASPAGSEDPPDTMLTGSLLDPTGRPIRNAWSAWCSITDVNGVRLNCDAKSGGAFVFSHVAYGSYWVTANVFGFRMLQDVVELRAGAAHVHKDFTLTRKPLFRIRVSTPDGTPLLKALGIDGLGDRKVTLVPVATRARPGPMIDEVLGSLNNPFGIGQFWQYGPLAEHLPPDCMGVVLLDEEPPAYVSLLNWHAVLQTKEVHAGDEEVLFVLRPDDVLASSASIRVQVMDSDGLKSLTGASVAMCCHGETLAQGGTGPDGIALLEGILPTVGEVYVSAKDHARLTIQVSAKPGEVTDLGQVTLEPALQVHGLVIDPEGKPTSASFQLLSFDRTAGKFLVDEQGHGSGADGQFTLPALGRELYLLRAANVSAFNDQDAEAAKLVCEPVSIDLRRGTVPDSLRLQLVAASRLTLLLRGETSEFMRFRISDAHGNEVFADRFWWLSPYPLSLPPGTYSVELLTPERVVLATKSVTLGSTPLTLELGR